MKLLASRRKILIAESELNRAGLAADVAAINVGLQTLSRRAKSVGAIASSAAWLLATVTAFRSLRPAANASRPSWLRTIAQTTGLVSTIWMAIRPNEESRTAPRRPGSSPAAEPR